ncbi:hypothetical protein C0081_19735 [Cohaesibacter celericrescens]|uniref:Uncharacterized protein n=1 Tax=Cohaesibacter celericrescens TaxID=2067669 RepID=A0A2N5XLJ3_9HYPH|nr:hypothetical protein C0081_19735 [Cohaesibacter celericrescens]
MIITPIKVAGIFSRLICEQQKHRKGICCIGLTSLIKKAFDLYLCVKEHEDQSIMDPLMSICTTTKLANNNRQMVAISCSLYGANYQVDNKAAISISMPLARASAF